MHGILPPGVSQAVRCGLIESSGTAVNTVPGSHRAASEAEYAAARWKLRAVKVVCLRSRKGRFNAERSLLVRVELPELDQGTLLISVHLLACGKHDPPADAQCKVVAILHYATATPCLCPCSFLVFQPGFAGRQPLDIRRSPGSNPSQAPAHLPLKAQHPRPHLFDPCHACRDIPADC